MIRKIAQDQGREAAYRMIAIGMVSNHLLTDHIQEEIKNAAERQKEEIEEATDAPASSITGNARETENFRQAAPTRQAAPCASTITGNARVKRWSTASSWLSPVTAPASDTCQTNVTVEAPPALSITGRARETEDSELQAGGPEQVPAAGEASSRFSTVTAPADTCQTLDETGKFVRARVKPFMYTTGGIVSNQLLEQDEKVAERQQVTDQAGGSGEHAPAAGEASSWFPTETAPAETFNETVKAEAQNTDIMTIENENDANKTVLIHAKRPRKVVTWEDQAGGSVEQAPAAGEASSRFPTETAPASDTCQTTLAKMEDSEPDGDQANLQVGTYVIVRKPQWLKGETGKILGYDNYSGRYRVRITTPTEPRQAVQKIKATNLVAVTRGNPEKWKDIIIEDDKKWGAAMELEGSKWYEGGGPDGSKRHEAGEAACKRLFDGSLLTADYDNPHFRRLASKLLKAGIYLQQPALMNVVSSYIYAARENGAIWQSIRQKEALEIKEMQDARRGEIM